MDNNNNFNTANNGEFRDIERSLNFEQRRKLDLTLQLLNESSNVYQEFDNVSDLFTGLSETTQSYTNNDFKNSLKATKDCFEDPKKIMDTIDTLKNNDTNSFLIEPLMSDNHMFASVIRKVDDDYSITIVNKGGREPERKQYEEYVVDKKIAPRLMYEIASVKGELETEQIYKTFENQSKEKYKLNVESRNQKTGNCFIKEPATAVKYAFATKGMTKEQLLKLRDNSIKKPYKPKFNGPSEYAQYLLTGRFSKGDNKLHKVITNEFNNYFKNKKFRTLLSDGKSPERSLLEGFNANTKDSKNIAVKNSLKLLNIDSFNQKPREISSIVKKANDKDQIDSFNTVYKYSTWEGRGTYFEQGTNTKKLVTDLLQAEKSFPVVTTQVRKELSLGYFMKAVPNLITDNFKRAIKDLQNSNILYKHNSRNYFLEGLCNSNLAERAKKNNPKKVVELNKRALNLYSHAINLKPNFADAFALRAMTYQELGDMENANKDYEKAKELKPDIFDEVKQNDGKNGIHTHFTRKNVKDVLTQITPHAVNSKLQKIIPEIINKAAKNDIIANRKRVKVKSKINNITKNSRKYEAKNLKEKMLKRNKQERSRAI